MPSTFFTRLEARTPQLVLATVAVIAALVVPFLTMAPETSASTEPGGVVFEARDRIDERFVSSVHLVGVIAEPAGGDVLLAAPLGELLAAEDRLRADPELGPTLLSWYDPDLGVDAVGVASLADLVDAELRATGVDGVAAATDGQVKEAGAAVIERFGSDSPMLGLSTQSTVDAAGVWVVPAVQFPVLADDNVLGFGNTSINLGGDTAAEEYGRSIQDVLRTADGWQVNGIAIDVNLTSQEQGAVAGPFIGLTVLAALLIVGLAFRSYWVLAVTSVAFLMLIIWLKGITNLLGFEDDLVLSLIVPIAMVSFGVDFVFHAVGRYREEREAGKRARAAVIGGMGAVSGALLLAVLSDAAAFLANATAGIESIVQFGVGAAIALVGADLLLGIVTPFVVARIESVVPAPAPGRRSTVARVVGSVGVASLAMAAVLMLVFVLPWLGVVLTVLTAMAAVAIPFAVQRRRAQATGAVPVGDLDLVATESGIARRLGALLARIAARPGIVLPAALLVTAVATVFALQVPTRFDVEDFFSSDTDFVVGLNQLDEHVGDRGGEPAQLYIEGDLTSPDVLAALAGRVDELENLGGSTFARDGGRVAVQAGIFELFDRTRQSPVMGDLVADRTGVVLTDTDGDGIPDTAEQVRALVETASVTGVPLDAQRLLLTPDAIRTAVDLGTGSQMDATVFELMVPNSRSQTNVLEARQVLTPIAEQISDDLGGSFVQATGSAFVREASLEGTSRALAVSLPVALFACFSVATLFLRSIRYGLASIVPILMVVAWLYAVMQLTGFAINLVTATIAAVSIGIGIDFALHFIARYREELERRGDPIAAVRIAGEGTGIALVASAISSAVGFGILAFAPMPLFASYGLLTALMIVMALAATLVVLPSVLVAADRIRLPKPVAAARTSQATPMRSPRIEALAMQGQWASV